MYSPFCLDASLTYSWPISPTATGEDPYHDVTIALAYRISIQTVLNKYTRPATDGINLQDLTTSTQLHLGRAQAS